MPELEIIIPVLNEQDTIGELVRRLDKALKLAKIKYGLIFVDDHSTDKTVSRIRALRKKYPIRLRTKKGLKGKAYSILEGAKVAKAMTLAMIDGDLQYPPEAIPAMYELSKKNAVVVANRKKSGICWLRRFGSHASSVLVGKLILGIDCDAQSGLKVFRRKIIEQISDTEVKPWAFDMPLLYAAQAMGEKIGTVDVEFSERKRGSSKVNFVQTALEIITTAVRLRLRGRKIHIIAPENDHPTLGAGLVYKRKKYITHTKLSHGESALETLVGWQKWVLVVGILLFGVGLVVDHLTTLVVLAGILSAIYFADVIFSGWVLVKSLHFPPELKFSKRELSAIDERVLPVYSILCPLYKEGRVLGDFVKAIRKLDWPKRKLEVLLLLEEDDKETLEEAGKLRLPNYFRVIVVPNSMPRTKPKACNYGLAHARGEYVVVYDAEDRPDPMQLKKAYLGFKKFGEKVFCLQSKLNYYNPEHNLLTRLFTAEYSLWFDVVLPGLQSIEASIPLGGTSNHFRTKDLVRLNAWDPFNVTEDCDLGVRIFKAGYKTAIIDSTTYEEANSSIGNWVRQRSRWIKGYIQTYLVHMRNPVDFIKKHGLHALVFQLIIGMRMSFMLINPFLWAMTIAYFAARSTVGVAIEALYPAPVFYIAAFALVVGNFMYIFNYMIGAAKRGHWGLIKYVFLVPLYWVLTSVAAAKAIYQLFFKPHFWEKTHHGIYLSRVAGMKASAPRLGLNLGDLPRGAVVGLFKQSNVRAYSGLLLVVASIISNFLNFVTSAYLGRYMSAEGFGLIALLSSFLFIAQLPASGVNQTVAHQTAFLYGKYKYPVGEIWRRYRPRILNISLVLSVLWLLGSPLSAEFFNSQTLIPFIVFAPVWAVLLLRAVDDGYLQGSHKFQWLAIVTMMSSSSKLLFSYLFVKLGLSEWVYAALPLSLAVAMLGGWLFARRVATKYMSKAKREKDLEINLKFSKRFFTSSFFAYISSLSFLSLDLIFVKHYLSAVLAGQYALLVLVGRMVYMIGGLSSQFMLPFVSRESGAGRNSSKIFSRLLLLVLLSTSFAFVLVGPLGRYTVPALFGYKAYPILPYLTPFAFSMILFSVAYSIVIYHQAKRQYLVVLSGVVALLFQAIMLCLFHKDIGEVVSSMVLTGAIFLVLAITLHLYQPRIKTFTSNITDFLGLFEGLKSRPKGYGETAARILIFNWRDIKHVWSGGAEVYIHELSKRWVLEGHKVTLFCGNDGKNKRSETIDGVEIIRRGGFYTVYLWAFLYYMFRFRNNYDVVIDSENGIPFFSPLYAKVPVIGLIHHIHSEIILKELKLPFFLWPVGLLAKNLESRVMPLVYKNCQIVTVSESSRKDLIRLGFGKVKPVKIVNPGVDLSILKPRPKAKVPTVLYLGRLKPYKSLDTLIKATRELVTRVPKIKVQIAGYGESRASLERLVKELGLTSNITFLGKVSEKEKIRLMGRSWVFVYPSTFEGWGISVIEANACGTPVVASRVPGLVDSVRNPHTGYTVMARDEKAFAEKITKLIKNERLRNKFSKDSVLWAQEFSWDVKQKDFLNIIRAEVDSRRRG